MTFKEFIEYVYSFYGNGGIYDFGATKNDIMEASVMHIQNEHYCPDSYAREKVRDILIDKFGYEWKA